ncbi:MAG: hypothetical protein LBK99_25335 [Opitutaceae bacterium]|jgi:hypothetical protein|nr:hypothetical protein [Opitutaceae bacterium]
MRQVKSPAALTHLASVVRFYFNIDNCLLIPQPGSRQIVNNITLVRGSFPMLEIQFIRRITDAEPDFVWFCMKEQGKYDGGYLVLCENFEKINEGTEGDPVWVWRGILNLNTVPLNKMMGYDPPKTANDKASVTVNGEIGFRRDNEESLSLQFNVTVKNSLYHGDTSAPDEAVSGAATAAANRAESAAEAAEAAQSAVTMMLARTVTGTTEIPVGADTVSVEFPTPFDEVEDGATITILSLVLQRPVGGNNILIPWVEGEPINEGFTLKFNGEPDIAGYHIRYTAQQVPNTANP